MPLNIKDERTHELARRVAGLTGESLTAAVRAALEERLDHLTRERAREEAGRAERLAAIVRAFNALPVLDDRRPDEILGYDKDGLPA